MLMLIPLLSTLSLSPLYRAMTESDYARFSDEAMEELHARLEEMVEEYSPEGQDAWEVEYSVGLQNILEIIGLPPLSTADIAFTVRSSHTVARPAWYICDQQATPEPADLVEQPIQVSVQNRH